MLAELGRKQLEQNLIVLSAVVSACEKGLLWEPTAVAARWCVAGRLATAEHRQGRALEGFGQKIESFLFFFFNIKEEEKKTRKVFRSGPHPGECRH